MEWTDETITRLSTLWAEGLSTAEIGRRMGISKNAVVGKAHRLLLSPRPSPIRRGVGQDRLKRRSSLRRVLGPTLPSLAEAPPIMAPSMQPVASEPAPVRTEPRRESQPEPRVSRVLPVTTPALPVERRRAVACCWPIGEPGTRSFRFCDDNSLQGKPYCATHAALAYVKVRDRREDAA